MQLKRKTLRSIKILLASLFLGTGLHAQQLVDGVVAVVGQRIILMSEVEQQYESLLSQGYPGGITKCQVFEELLLEKMLLHHAELDSVVVSEEEAEGTMDRRIEMLVAQIGSVRKLEEFYKKSVVEIKEEMRELVSNQLTAQKMQGEITGKVEITPTEVRMFYNDIPEDSLPLINAEVEIAQIVKFPEVKEEAKKAAIDKLNELKKRVEEGSNFATLAVLYSEDPGSAKNGGEYTSIKRGQFQKEFEAVAFNLKKGEVSEPFKTIFGYHIVQLLAKRGEELDLRHILIKPKISQQDLDEAREFLDSIHAAIDRGEITFAEAAEKYSEDEETKFNEGLMMNPNTGDTKWEVNQLEKGIFYAVQNLYPGQITDPIFMRTDRGQEAFRLVRLLKKTEPHRANLADDYYRLQAVALQEKKERTMNEWLEEKLKETYVKVNNSYFNCTFENNWTKTPTDEQP